MAGQIIEGISRSLNGTWSLDTRDAEGIQNTVPAAEFFKVVANKVDGQWCDSATAVDTHAFVTELHDWKLLMPDAASHPFAHLVSSNRHGTYEFKHEEKRVLVPASVVIAALFAPTRYSFPYLLWPLGIGLETLCVPELNVGVPRVIFSPRVPAAAKNVNTSLLSWAHSFPSARQAWSSIFEYASRGELNISLPKIRISFNGSCLEDDNSVFLTAIRLTSLAALEAPFEYAKSHPLAFDVDGSRSSRPPPPLVEDSSKESLFSLSSRRLIPDATWDAVAPCLASVFALGVKDEQLKLTVELVCHKHATGAPWHYFRKSHPALASRAKRYLRLWRGSGAWAQAHATLVDHGLLQPAPSYYQAATKPLGRKFLSTPLTDAQWAKIDHLFNSGANVNREKIHVSRRVLVDAIHHKFHSGVVWRALRSKQSERQKIQNYYQLWVRSGVWAESIAILAQQGAFRDEENETTNDVLDDGQMQQRR